jgi:diadenosine tetraphosphatase ApaH/serine/threonine PP2A family protein phosphatase
VCLAGNHDLLALGTIVLAADFNPDAAAAGAWTAQHLDAPSRRFLAGLEPQGREPGAALFHASPRDPVWEYVLSEGAVRTALELTSAPVVLVGHSHIPIAASLDNDGLAGGHAPDGTEVAFDGARWLLNPGSVGQPRDGDPRAAWLLIDSDAGSASFRRVEYDVAATQVAIRAAGLPAFLAERLAVGL